MLLLVQNLREGRIYIGSIGSPHIGPSPTQLTSAKSFKKTKNMRWYVVLVVFTGLVIPRILESQSTNASLAGRITDPRKAIIADAVVTAINTGTGMRYLGSTNEAGLYYVSNL